ncbi:MAG TPA: ABC transporter ATP-binding protein [Candidatus Acidoferrales bacterium]|nr:ABC transporter ATP-binding protein [Candidatus Acidoferrales bacterium]
MEETLVVQDLEKTFRVNRGFSPFSRKAFWVRAVDHVSFKIGSNEILGLAGESGCGKTTTGRTVLKLFEPTGGKIFFEGHDITDLGPNDMKKYRPHMQMVFQDPYRSLNPRKNVMSLLSLPIETHGLAKNRSEKLEMIMHALDEVRLHPPERYVYKYPHELSGGERQRIALARVLVLRPKLIVADEPVSMLDALVRIGVLDLLLDLKKKTGFACLFVTHDLALARYTCDRIAIMYLGKIVEIGSKDAVISQPAHPYTKALISAVPVPNPSARKVQLEVKGDVPSPLNVPSGCPFHTRCPYADDRCRGEEQQLIKTDEDHYVACYKYNLI